MTKADIVREIAKKTGIENATVLASVEAFMETVKESLAKEENVYLRGFGSFILKKRAAKTARNISKNTTLIIPEHNIPAFKPAKTFAEMIKKECNAVSGFAMSLSFSQTLKAIDVLPQWRFLISLTTLSRIFIN